MGAMWEAQAVTKQQGIKRHRTDAPLQTHEFIIDVPIS